VKILCLTDFPVRARRAWLWDHLPPGQDQVDFLCVQPPVDRFAGWGKILVYSSPTYWRLAWQALIRTRQAHYDIVVAWESKNGLPFACLRRLFRRPQPKLVILFFSVKGLIMHSLPVARYAMRAVDHISVPTHAEIDYYSQLLDFPTGRITCCPLGMYDLYAGSSDSLNSRSEPYIFAGGRSDRDYDTLVQAASGLDLNVVINARRFNLAGIRLPPNVKVNDLMPFDQLRDTLSKAKFVVVPLQNVPHAAGLSQIVLAMSAGKAVIATATAGTIDYVEQHQTGILVEPGNVLDLRRSIKYLTDHPIEAERMGSEARSRYEQRHTFPRMAHRVHEILQGI